jgi:hypothetical protein
MTTADSLVKYTYYGDADLSGAIDGADYHQIDVGFGMHLTGWYNGDFNYDGIVDGADYALIDNTFNEIAAINASPLTLIAGPDHLVPQSGATSVPEPAIAGALWMAGLYFLSHRRRRSAEASR